MSTPNRPLVGVLIVAVIVIWGIILYKIFFTFSGARKAVSAKHAARAAASATRTLRQLSSYEKDPFLKIFMDTVADADTQIVEPNRAEAVVQPAMGSLAYHGYISDSNRLYAVLTDTNKAHFVPVGQKYREFTVVTASYDSVTLRWKHKKIVLHAVRKN